MRIFDTIKLNKTEINVIFPMILDNNYLCKIDYILIISNLLFKTKEKNCSIWVNFIFSVTNL